MNQFPNVIVDTSYVAYYTAFSVMSWYKREFHWEFTNDIQFKPSEDTDWQDMFRYKFKYNIQKPASKKFPFIDLSRVFFAIDCKRDDIWRNSIYPNYKITRRTAPKQKPELHLGDFFKFLYDQIIPEFIDLHNSTIVRSPGAEGDDIIAALVSEFKDSMNVIIASDKDLKQLLAPNVFIITIDGKEYDMEGLTREQFVMLKAIMGDGGDDVPQLYPRCGYKTALKLLQNPKQLKAKLNESKEMMDRFKTNLALVDFKYIPTIILEDVKKQLASDEVVNWNNL